MASVYMLEDLRDLAVLVANIIRRMGAAYGSSDDWRRDVTTAVKIMERMNVRANTMRGHSS